MDPHQRRSTRRDSAAVTRSPEGTDPGRARATQYSTRYRLGWAYFAVHGRQCGHGCFPGRSYDLEARAVPALRACGLQGGIFREYRRVRDSATMARDWLRLYSVSTRCTGGIVGCVKRAPVPGEARSPDREAIREGGELLLERGDVLLEGVRSTGCSARV